MALRLIPRSSRRSGFLVAVTGAMREHCRQLDVSVETSEPRSFAVRFPSAFVFRAKSVHRIPPRVRDDREPPPCETRRGGLVEMICPTAQGEICGKGWRGKCD